MRYQVHLHFWIDAESPRMVVLGRKVRESSTLIHLTRSVKS